VKHEADQPVSGDSKLQSCTLESLTTAVRYHSWLTNLVRPYLGEHPLEIGSGLGDYAQTWIDSGTPQITVSDRDPSRFALLPRTVSGLWRGFRHLNGGSYVTTPWRWRWDLNPRWAFTHTRFRVLRTHVQARSETSAPCSTGRSASVAEPSRTTTNETRQLRRRESDSCPAGCGISEPCSGRCPSPRLAERGRGGRPGTRGPRRPLRRCALSTSTPSQSRSPVPPSRPPVCYLPMPSVRPRRNCR